MMSPELIGIIAVGVALAGLFWRMFHSLDSRLSTRLDEFKSDLNRRMDELKADLNGRMDELNVKVDALGRDHYELRERTGRIEVWLEVLLGRRRPGEEAVPIHQSVEPPPRTPPRE